MKKLLVLLLMFPALGLAATGPFPGFRSLTISDGLSNNSVRSVLRDSNGFIWVGTTGGLNRFDGYSFISFRHGDQEGLPSNVVLSLYECGGKIYINTDSGCCAMDLETYSFRPLDYDRLYADSDGMLWLSRYNDGLWQSPDGVVFEKCPLGESLPNEYVSAFLQYGQDLLIHYQNGILAAIDRRTGGLKWMKSNLSSGKEATILFKDSADLLWYNEEKTLKALDLRSGEMSSLPQRIPSVSGEWIRTMTEDSRGKFWLGTTDGIIKFDKMEGVSDFIPGPTVQDLYADTHGIVWVGTYKEGLSYWHESMSRFSLAEGEDISCTTTLPDGSVLMGSEKGERFTWDTTQSLQPYPGIPGIRYTVVSLLRDRAGNTWTGTFQGGLYRKGQGGVRHFSETDGFPGNNVWALTEDAGGNVWAGLLGGGLVRIRADGNLTCYAACEGGLPDNYVSSLAVSGDSLYIAFASRGFCILNLRDGRFTSKIPLMGDIGITQIYPDASGRIWIATIEGLKCYDPSSDKLIPLPEGLPADMFYSLVQDRTGLLWAASQQDLYCLRANGDHSYSCYRFTREDGLPEVEFNQRAASLSGDGQVVIGTTSGLLHFQPFFPRESGKRILLTGMSLFGESILPGREHSGRILLEKDLNSLEELRLSHSQNFVSFSFSTDDYAGFRNAPFYYTMQGMGGAPVRLQPGEHSVSFTDLSPGKYVFTIFTEDGLSSHPLTIRIMPPLGLSPAFISLYLLLFATLLVLMVNALRHRRENRLKINFFTSIGHDLRTPLTLILTPLEEMMDEEADGSPRKKKYQLMHRNAKYLSMLVDQILDFRKTSEGKTLRLSPSGGDLVSFVKTICGSFSQYARNSGIRFSFNSNVSSLPAVFDADKVEKILMNLLSNAFKFTPSGGEISVTVDKDGEKARIRVADTGIGIPDAEKRKVFQRFYQASNRDVSSAGTGIGLSLVKEYARLMNGDITLADNPGGGSVFTLRLPLQERPETAVLDEPAAQVPDAGCLFKVLVVDDNPDLRTYLSDSLKSLYQVYQAENGEDGLRLALQEKPDLIVCDVMMPGMDGLQMTRQLKKTPQTAHIPVILLTARQTDEERVEGLRSGAEDYLSKPFNLTILMLRIQKLIDLHKDPAGKLIDPSPSEITITSLDEEFVEKAVKCVEGNISSAEYKVEDLAADMSMNRVTLYKRLMKVTGRTPREFIRLIRLKRAAQLLKESQRTVAEIAYEVGFNNPKYFSRYFRDEFGMLPTRFRNT